MPKVEKQNADGSKENRALGSSIRYFRIQSGITARLLCSIMNRSYGWCNMIEKGHAKISVPDLFKFIDTFGVTPNEFYDRYKKELENIEHNDIAFNGENDSNTNKS